MGNKPAGLINASDRVRKGLSKEGVLGLSLAHGLAKRGLRDDYETIQNRYHNAIKKYKSKSNSRRASFIRERRVFLQVFKENTLSIVEVGKQDGTDKKAYIWLLSIYPSKRIDNEELVFGIWAHYVYARHPSKFTKEQIALVTGHCLARMMQTVRVDNVYDAIIQLFDSLGMTFSLTMACRNDKCKYDQQFAILSEHGVIVAEYIEEYGMTFCRTAIAYTAMTPKKAKHLQKLFNDDDRIINWKKQGTHT